ncbi:5-hydroxytryptamine receptor 3A-like [Paramisgurnus dabryanus]|uniref:5-hydroxytryptamine receptor 3A-like n=1 Tax=Paramisgurnus dabryanus TaxID=90735 RepID=UPI0031F3D8F8
MYLHWVTFSLALVCWMSAGGEYCGTDDSGSAYRGLFNFLSSREDNLLNNTRPLTSVTVTKVYVDLYVTSITDVNEKAQSISTQVKIFTFWKTRRQLWDPADYCDIETITVQKDLLWTPDIAIAESIDTQFGSKESPYVHLVYEGLLYTVDILSVTSACKMDLYRFPFDTQICNLTLQSLGYTDEELNFHDLTDSKYLTSESQQNFQTQGEWELLNINASIADCSTMWFSQNRKIFKITIRRRPLLYIINLIFPVFCFLVLDVASFLINASESEKLGFKVTLLLSISVLLLILNDKLPSTASQMPLIGIYCIGVFSLIGISILETIFVSILIAIGEETKPVTPTESGVDVTVQHDGVKYLHLDTVTGRTEQMTPDKLKQILMEFWVFTQQHQEKVSSCWTLAARIVNVIFTVLYIITVIVFLSFLGKVWFQF